MEVEDDVDGDDEDDGGVDGRFLPSPCPPPPG